MHARARGPSSAAAVLNRRNLFLAVVFAGHEQAARFCSPFVLDSSFAYVCSCLNTDAPGSRVAATLAAFLLSRTSIPKSKQQNRHAASGGHGVERALHKNFAQNNDKKLVGRKRAVSAAAKVELSFPPQKETPLPEKNEKATVVLYSLRLPCVLHPFSRGDSFGKKIDRKRKRERPCTHF